MMVEVLKLCFVSMSYVVEDKYFISNVFKLGAK